MEQYILYLYMKQLIKSIDESYNVSFNDIDLNKPKSVGIYIKGAEVSNYRIISDGSIYNFKHRVQFILQGNNTKAGLLEILDISSKLRETLIHTYNSINNEVPLNMVNGGYSEVDENNTGEEESYNVGIMKVDLLGEVDFKGKTSQNIPRYSLNIKVAYWVSKKKGE